MRDPDKVGVARAWRIEQNEAMAEGHVREFGYPPCSIGPTWLINGPYHPMWSWWYLGLISLADQPGVPPAHRRYPGAEYELMIMSLDPDPKPPRPKIPDIEACERGDAEHGLPGFLSPPDLVFQFDGITDEQAITIAEFVVDHIVAGRSCDSDFRSSWEESLAKTVSHYRRGIHA